MTSPLLHSALSVIGRLPGSTNNALVVALGDWSPDDDLTPEQIAVYKPVAGERPLWDFPAQTLAKREVAAAHLDAALDFGLVPATVWREDGPAGPGMVQQWWGDDSSVDVVSVTPPGQQPTDWSVVLHAYDENDQPVVVSHPRTPALELLCAFDVVANNADRKAGHVLSAHGTLAGIDHGLTFHLEPKLRTVFWGFADQPLSEHVTAGLTKLLDDFDAFAEETNTLLPVAEIDATAERAEQLLSAGVFPRPTVGSPAVPWPLF